MSSFTEDLIVTVLNDGTYRVEKGFDYHVGYEGSGDIIHVPAKFISDFFTTPIFSRFVFPQSQYRGNQASVLHDYLYHTQERSRKEADNIFLEAMKVLGVPLLKRRIMWAAVRVGGGFPWRNHAKKNAKKIEKIVIEPDNKEG